MTTGDVEITIVDGGAAIVVPGQTVQFLAGCSSAGTVGQVVASQNPNTIASIFGYGEMPELAALSALAGGTMVMVRCTEVTPGAIRKKAVSNIASSTNASPIVVTTSTPHGLVDNDIVTIASHLVNTNANGTWKIDVLSSTTFSLLTSTGNGVGGATGTVTPDGVNQTGTGTSEITATGTPLDNYYIKFLCTTGGTIGVTGIKFRLSLDAGRNYGPVIALNTANTYAISNTGITLNFAAGTLVANDAATFSTTGPLTDTGGILAAIDAFKASAYAIAGVGSSAITGLWTGANAATFQTTLDAIATNDFIYTRMMMAARDASPPAIWGGTGETDATWTAALAADFAAAQAKRVVACGGYYNMPSAFRNSDAGTPRYRRPLSFALAARQVTIPPQRHAGRVRDGALTQIVIDPTNDPQDGFIYHDERILEGLDIARLTSARTRIGLPGMYIVNPNTLAQVGSNFARLPMGNVMDVACGIVHRVGQQTINSDVRCNDNGTIYENEALAIEREMYNALSIAMISTNQISNASVVVNRTQNVLATSIVKVRVTITARGYVEQEDIEIGFTDPLAAGAA